MTRIIFTLLVLCTYSTSQLFAQPYGHRYSPEQANQNITVDINTTIRVSVEWGEGDWTSSNFGYGLTSDGTNWTWVDLPWFENGDGANKRCRADVSIDTPGKYYYAYRIDKGGTISYSFGSADWAQNSTTLAAISTIAVGEFSIADGNWGSGATWNSGVVPDNTKNVGIYHTVSLNQNGDVKSLIINNGAVFNGSSAKVGETLTIADGGSITNNGTFAAGSGKVAFAGAGTVTGSFIFNDVDISGGVDFGSSSTVTGFLSVLPNGFANTNAPTYGASSTLIFATGGSYSIDASTALWVAGGTLGKGVPQNVQLTTTNPLNIFDARDVIGNLSINSGTSVVQGNNIFIVQGNLNNNGNYSFVNDGENALTVKGNFTNDGAFALGALPGADLYIQGNFTDNGTFTDNTRLVLFNGSALQTLNGSSETTFGYFTVAADAQVEAAADKKFNINKELTVSAAKEGKAAGSFTLKSDANGTASMKLPLGSVVSGDINVERFLTGTDWHFLSSPVANQTIVGPENFIDFPSGIGERTVDFYKFNAEDESGEPWVNIKNNDGSQNPSFETSFVDAQGYLVAYAVNPGDNVVKNFTGVPHIGAFAAILKNSPDKEQVWNLIGNPYTSAINWAAGGIVTLGLDQAYYQIYNPQMNGGGGGFEYFKDFTAPSSPGTNGRISSMQGFFVKVDPDVDTKMVQFSQNAMEHNDQAFFKFDFVSENLLNIKIHGEAYYSQTQIFISENGHPGLDENDASMLFSLNSQVSHVYSVDGSEKMVMNAVPFPNEDYSIPLGIKVGNAGTYSITAPDVQQFNSSCTPVLEDSKTGDQVNLRENPSYTFEVTEPGINNSRFVLHMKSTVGIEETGSLASISVSILNNELRIYNLKAGNYQIRVMDIMGRVILQEELNSQNTLSLSPDIKAGAYIVQVSGNNGQWVNKVIVR